MKPRILIVSGCDKQQEEFGRYAFTTIKNYANKWGYVFKTYINNDFFRTLPPHYPQPFNTTALNESDPTLAVETCLFLYLLLFFHMNE